MDPSETLVPDPRACQFEEGSGNVFADLDLPNADEELAKAIEAKRREGVNVVPFVVGE